jgi:NADPH:quinone reductase-like Zn-dependent oxidoreductase
LREIEKPTAGDNEVLLKVSAASLHAGDYFLTTGIPYIMRLGLGLRRPRKAIPGFDVAGIVEAVGSKVTGFATGDEVFGESNGSCAEYVVASPDKLTKKPANLSLEHAATIAVSGSAALRGIRDAGRVKAGDKVLINGAAGGVGTYAVQIAKALGAEVTGVCGTGNVEMVRSIGADHIIDYTEDDFTAGETRYDVILDNVANHPLSRMRRAVASGGKLVPNSGRSEKQVFGAVGRMLNALISSIFIRRQGRPYFAPVTKHDLADLKDLIESGKVTPVIGETYPLAETPVAIAAIGAGHSRGKVIITP